MQQAHGANVFDSSSQGTTDHLHRIALDNVLPTFSITSMGYPGSQRALKLTEQYIYKLEVSIQTGNTRNTGCRNRDRSDNNDAISGSWCTNSLKKMLQDWFNIS